MQLRITDRIAEHEKETILQALREYNLARIEDRNPQDLGIYYEDDTGGILGGLIGDTHGNWLTVQFLWVSDALRGQGIGGRILEQAEATARERGCKYAFLDTFGFQAPAFYEKKGYGQVFALEEYPVTGKRHYFIKQL